MKELREGIDSASLQGFAPIKVQVTRGQGDTLARGSVKYIKRWMSDYVATGSPRVPMSPCQLVPSIKVAERKGFEPLSPLRGCLISSQVQSTTLPSLRPTKETPSGFYLKPIR